MSNEYLKLYVITDSNQEGCGFNKFPANINTSNFKNRLEMITGILAKDITSITLLDSDGNKIGELSDKNFPLKSPEVKNEMKIIVKGQIEDGPSEITKFELSDEQYASRSGTVKEFLRSQRLGKYDPDYQEKKREQIKREKDLDELAFATIEVGNRCEVNAPGEPASRGCVMYKGKLPNEDDLYIGVKYDEPFGDCDGTIRSVRLFEALSSYGKFVKPRFVKVGDYPEEASDFDSGNEI